MTQPLTLSIDGPILLIASGKGGVGKSTVATNVAAGLAGQGLTVGLLDADIYGPSVPLMMGLSDQRPLSENGQIVPLMAHGVKIASIGFLLPQAGPVAWRGAMVHKAIVHLLAGVAWGHLDALIVDMPPGTGDAHLTLIQKAHPQGAIIVSTPQEAALTDARRAAGLFVRMGVPLWGFVETMAGEIFGSGGVEALAHAMHAPLLTSIPLESSVRIAGDAGTPVVLSNPSCAPGQAFTSLIKQVIARL